MCLLPVPWSRILAVIIAQDYCLFLAQQPPSGQGLLIYEVSRSHSFDTLQSAGLLWTSDQLVAETST